MKTMGLAAALLVATGAAFAQQDQGGALTSSAVEEFVSSLAADAQTAVRNDDWQGIRDWIAQHVSEDASVALRGTVSVRGGPVSDFETAMDGTDLHGLAQMALGQNHMMMLDAVEDYSLWAGTQFVNELPGGQASAYVLFRETGTLAAPGEDAALPDTMFEALSECILRLEPAPDGPRIVNVACDVVTMM